MFIVDLSVYKSRSFMSSKGENKMKMFPDQIFCEKNWTILCHFLLRQLGPSGELKNKKCSLYTATLQPWWHSNFFFFFFLSKSNLVRAPLLCVVQRMDVKKRSRLSLGSPYPVVIYWLNYVRSLGHLPVKTKVPFVAFFFSLFLLLGCSSYPLPSDQHSSVWC
jgi:hypothetical protein